jgi:DNA-binding transcriptional regulator GbsR (MarR family)
VFVGTTAEAHQPDIDHAESIRRDFARAWGGIGAAWGVAPSTAAVQGYLLLHGGPLTSSEIQTALGLSHRATRTAIADCESWGIVERAPLPRRGGSRGPAGTAWLPVGDHWEWFRRVASSRIERETDPILPLLDACLAEAQGAPDEPGIPQLLDRLQALVEFTHRFDRAVGVVVRMDSADIGSLFDVLDRIPDDQLDRLLTTLARMPADDLVRTAALLSEMTPTAIHRLVGLAGQPGVSKLVGFTLGRGGSPKDGSPKP